MENINKNEIPIRWGFIIGIVGIVITTFLNLFVLSNDGMMSYYIGLAISFIIIIVMMVISAKKQRKQMGGYITLKESFRGLFISILIICVLSALYQIIYTKFIDPDFTVRLKDATINFTEKMGAPQDKLDEVAEDFDKQMAERKTFSKQLLSVMWAIVFYSIVGFIIAAVVKKNKPIFNEDESANQQFQH